MGAVDELQHSIEPGLAYPMTDLSIWTLDVEELSISTGSESSEEAW